MMMGGGGGDGGGDGLGRMGIMPLQLNPGEMPLPSPVGSRKDERVPQWGHQETRDFIAIRAELERDFTLTKRNKTLWEVVSARLKELGYRRSPDQCKCKWKNLVNRYKGKETSDPENGRQCPFFDELHAVFTERANNMQRLLMESEAGGAQAKKKMKRVSVERSSDYFSDEEEDYEEDSEEEPLGKATKKRKVGPKGANSDKSRVQVVQEMLHEFLLQQQKTEMQWQEMMERRAQERRMIEQEWQQSMEKLERERLMMEQAWREREEQRRMREESRAEKRDTLITMLLNKLLGEEL